MTAPNEAEAGEGVGGAVTIGDDVVAQVVGLTVLESYGIVGMASKRLVHGVARLLGRDALTSGVEVRRDGPDGVAIDLYVIMEHGLNLAEVAEAVRARVCWQVEQLVGIAPAAVGIHIQGVRREGR